jgi:serine/threonine-protein kinase
MNEEPKSPAARAAEAWRAFLGLPGVRPALRAALRFGSLGLVLGTLFLTSAVVSMRLALVGREVTVPEVTGLDPQKATEALAAQHLTLQVEGERYDLRVETGKILAQDPPAGTQIKRDRKVKVITSLGSKVISIPDLRGGASRKAQITLRQQGLKLGNLSYIHSPEVREDQVISQEPLPEAERVRDDRVNLLVSRGPEEPVYVMPDLVGVDAKQAQDLLKRRGFRAANVISQPGHDAAPGSIIRQNPLAGYPVRKRDVVTLVVNKE